MAKDSKTQTVRLEEDLREMVEKEIAEIKKREGIKPSASEIINKRVRMGYAK